MVLNIQYNVMILIEQTVYSQWVWFRKISLLDVYKKYNLYYGGLHMNKLSKKTSKREILKYMVIIMLFNIAIIMCLGINNKDNKVISKNNSKNIIHKEVVDGVEIEILADSGVFPKDASATIKKLGKQAETDKVKDAISKSAESSSKSIDSVYSYDITVKDSKGKELQPDTSKGEVIVVFKDIQGLDKNNGKSVKV